VPIGNLPAQVLFAGGIISPGLYQIKVVVPSLPSGDACAEIQAGTLSTTQVVLPIQSTGRTLEAVVHQQRTPTAGVRPSMQSPREIVEHSHLNVPPAISV
jgi:hypothetical protein